MNAKATKILDQDKFNLLTQKAKDIRLSILDMLTNAKSSHLGSAFSIVEILTVLYHHFIDVNLIKNKSKNRDYFILSKGHAASALYATLASVGIIDREMLNTYCRDGSKFAGHPYKDSVAGIEASTGSLGHGLSLAVGLAIASKRDRLQNKIYVLLGDGECQEGSVWEAMQLAVRLKLNNLVIIVDENKLQAFDRTRDIFVTKLEKVFSAFGDSVFIVNGHDFNALADSFVSICRTELPDVILAQTVKGKGVKFMQDKLEWHYRSVNAEEYNLAKKEILGS